jgi:hypothetical protein
MKALRADCNQRALAKAAAQTNSAPTPTTHRGEPFRRLPGSRSAAD